MLSWLRRRFRRSFEHRDSVPQSMFRMVMLDDNPYPTYIGTREWCDGKPFWSDGTCRCTHEERRL